MLELFLLIGGVLISSGFFSGSEAALVSISEPEIEAMQNKGRFGAAILNKLMETSDRCIIAIVVMNNVVNITGSILVGQQVVGIYGSAMLGVATTGLTFGLIIFSEIIPKSVGIHYAPKVAPLVAWPIWLLSMVLYPIVLALQAITNIFKNGERHVGTEEQIRSLVTLGRRAGHIENDEVQLIHRAFILNDKNAGDIMTDLRDMEHLQADYTIAKGAEKIKESQHSRFPVFDESIHDLEGTILQRDLLEALLEGKGEEPITSIIREGFVVNTELRSDKLLVLFREKSLHQAVVQAEGKTVGLVTLEDVLEELVGEIEDETDVED